jgi:signal peptidase II
MKRSTIVLLILTILLIDQASKIYIKTHFNLHETYLVAGKYMQLNFVENYGMAYGISFGGVLGKYALTIFRLIAVGFGVWFINDIIKKKYHAGFIICVALIFTGALGNLIDSMFYGLIFDRGMLYDEVNKTSIYYDGIASFGKGYAPFLRGNVVDMFYFDLFEGNYPNWIPFLGGSKFHFFGYIFNVADVAISTGIITLFIFQKRFGKKHTNGTGNTIETAAVVTDETQVQ